MTEYTDIYDLFLMQVKDFKLDSLYQSDPDELNTYLSGFLVLAISDFTNCKQDLSNRDNEAGHFNIDLTDKEKAILSELMVMRWLLKEIQDVLQIKNLLTDTDFKLTSAASNLTAKQNYLAVVREYVNQDMSNYALNNINWNDWYNGVFYRGNT